MTLKWDALSVLVKALFSSEVKISTVNALRIFNSSFGAIFRRSEECLHIIPTRENEGENGDIGPLRPFTLNLRTGRIAGLLSFWLFGKRYWQAGSVCRFDFLRIEHPLG